MSVKIAFRSAGEVCRSADNMLLTAWFYAALRPAGSVLVQTDKTWRCIYSGGKERILFADCGRSREKKVCNSLKNADVVVVNLTPKKETLDTFFHENRHTSEKILYLIGDCLGETDAIGAYMEHIHRIPPEQVGWIPHNEEARQALANGAVERFVRQYRNRCVSERNRRFFKEMERNLFLLSKRAEQQKN